VVIQAQLALLPTRKEVARCRLPLKGTARPFDERHAAGRLS
jgi:hypothetical protein